MVAVRFQASFRQGARLCRAGAAARRSRGRGAPAAAGVDDSVFDADDPVGLLTASLEASFFGQLVRSVGFLWSVAGWLLAGLAG